MEHNRGRTDVAYNVAYLKRAMCRGYKRLLHTPYVYKIHAVVGVTLKSSTCHFEIDKSVLGEAREQVELI
jgi:hypothetical protein